jgi:DNA-binding GntR family transcriptional regulator
LRPQVQEYDMTRAAEEKSRSNLQRQLASQILRYIRNNNLVPGAPLPEMRLAEEFKVSRTPVRAALEHLASQGIVDSTSRRGYAVAQSAKEISAAPRDADTFDDDALYMRITTDYMEDRLDVQFTEADLMRRYEVGHGLLNRVLQRMARDLVIERNPGHGWRFAPVFKSDDADMGSYRFRTIIEPAALLEPGYTLDRSRAAQVRREHEAIIATPRNKLSRIRLFHFYDMNAEFHELIAAGSGNAFLLQAVQQQNSLRRLLIYRWPYPLERIIESCKEHLELLGAVEKGEMEWASTLMRRHLELAARVLSEPQKAPAKRVSAPTKKR